MNKIIKSRGSLDCCSEEEIKENKKKGKVCKACNNTGYLVPKKKKNEKEV